MKKCSKTSNLDGHHTINKICAVEGCDKTPPSKGRCPECDEQIRASKCWGCRFGRRCQTIFIHKRDKIWAKTKGICYYCGDPLNPDTWTVDHVIPRCAGGSNKIENLQPTCEPCNSLKSLQDQEFCERLAIT